MPLEEKPMKILVPVKRVIDYNVHIQIKPDASGVVTDGVKMSMNPFDEIAVEAAVQLKEKGLATEVLAVTVGDSTSEDVLRTALAMGCDHAWRIDNDCNVPVSEARAIAKLLALCQEQAKADMIMMGKQAIDNDYNQTGQMLAQALDWPQATFASKIAIDGKELKVTREVDGGLETIACQLPAVVTTDLRLNTPRFIPLPNIIRAKQKTITVMPCSAWGVKITPHIAVQKVEAPSTRQAGEVVTDWDAFVGKLKEKGVL